MKRYLLILFFFQTFSVMAHNSLYKKVFPQYDQLKPVKVADTISDSPVNTELLVVYAKKIRLGFIREISTTTGCNTACLPVIYTSFYNAAGSFISILSKPGLTKIGHTPLSTEDLANLELILAMAPREFNNIKHPKELTDAISGETLKKFKKIVVKGGAYSTLRIHLYNQDTIEQIKRITLHL